MIWSRLNCQKYEYTTLFSCSTRLQNDEFPLIITHSPLENDKPLIMPGWIFSVACVTGNCFKIHKNVHKNLIILSVYTFLILMIFAPFWWERTSLSYCWQSRSVHVNNLMKPAIKLLVRFDLDSRLRGRGLGHWNLKVIRS
jgi:hypothetical protein